MALIPEPDRMYTGASSFCILWLSTAAVFSQSGSRRRFWKFLIYIKVWSDVSCSARSSSSASIMPIMSMQAGVSPLWETAMSIRDCLPVLGGS